MDFLKPKTGYRNLISYHKATCVYDVTYHFIERFLDKRDRTCDQMLQAARSGKQNIVEGRCAATTSKETEIKNCIMSRKQVFMNFWPTMRIISALEAWRSGHLYMNAMPA